MYFQSISKFLILIFREQKTMIKGALFRLIHPFISFQVFFFEYKNFKKIWDYQRSAKHRFSFFCVFFGTNGHVVLWCYILLPVFFGSTFLGTAVFIFFVLSHLSFYFLGMKNWQVHYNSKRIRTLTWSNSALRYVQKYDNFMKWL